MQTLGFSKDKSDEVMKKVLTRLKEFEPYFEELGVEGDSKSITKYFLTKLLIAKPDSDIEEIRDFLTSGTEPDLNELPMMDIQITSLMRSSFTIDRFLLFMLLTGQISEEKHRGLKKEIEDELISFLGDVNEIYHKLSDNVSRFILLNITESLLSKNLEKAIEALSSSQDITERFLDSPEDILQPLFKETLMNLRVSIYAASDLLGQQP